LINIKNTLAQFFFYKHLKVLLLFVFGHCCIKRKIISMLKIKEKYQLNTISIIIILFILRDKLWAIILTLISWCDDGIWTLGVYLLCIEISWYTETKSAKFQVEPTKKNTYTWLIIVNGAFEGVWYVDT